MNGWLWVGVAFLLLAWTIGAYAYGRAIGFSLGMLVGSKTLATSRGAGQESVRFPDRPVSRDEKHGGTGNGKLPCLICGEQQDNGGFCEACRS